MRTAFVLAGSFWIGLAACCGLESRAGFETFSNNTRINIPSLGIADVYPSAIEVTGVTGQIVNIQIALFGVSHTFPDDIAAVVVAPNGTSTLLFSGPGGSADAVNLNWVFDDNAAATLPETGALTSGTFRPGLEQWDDTFPAPGPGGRPSDDDPPPWQFTFAHWLTPDPNGQWRLFVIDSNAQDAGSIAGGWSVTFEVNVVPEPSAVALAGVMMGALLLRRRRRTA